MSEDNNAIQVGDSFYAIIKKSKYSKTLRGKERAGRRVGPFVCTGVSKFDIETEDRHFQRNLWCFVKDMATV